MIDSYYLVLNKPESRFIKVICNGFPYSGRLLETRPGKPFRDVLHCKTGVSDAARGERSKGSDIRAGIMSTSQRPA